MQITRTRALAAAAVIAALVIAGIWVSSDSGAGDTREVSYAEFIELIDSEGHGEVTVDEDTQRLEVPDGTWATYPLDGVGDLINTWEGNGVDVSVAAVEPPSLLGSLVAMMLPIAFIVGVLVWLVRGRSPLSALANHKRAAATPEVTFADVAGADSVVEDLQELCDMLTDPSPWETIGARAPKGVLFEGPPGTGKTLLAKALAGESGVPFYAISGADFVEVYAGSGAKRIRDLFNTARKAGRGVIFIDEIDAVGRARSSGGTGYEHERDSTLNALLVELDGFEARGNIIVVGATNRADVLDTALTRPGRFDRTYTVGAPERQGREALFELCLGHVQHDTGIDVSDYAARSAGMVGADIENVVQVAARHAVRAGRDIVWACDLDAALDDVTLGAKRAKGLLTDRDRQRVAAHEAGHATAALYSAAHQDPTKMSIVSRGSAGGVTWIPSADHQLATPEELHATLVVLLAGRGAEELLCGGASTGCSHDLERAAKVAHSLIYELGIDGDLYTGEDDPGTQRARCAPLIATAQRDAASLLEEHRSTLIALRDALLEHEELGIAEISEIVSGTAQH